MRNLFKISLLLFIGICFQKNVQASDSIKIVKVHILHGSKPLTPAENKTIGGLWGGHVVIELDSSIYGFSFKSKKIHLFIHSRKNAGIYQKETVNEWNNKEKTAKVTTIEIPVTLAQYQTLLNEYESYEQHSPHDYAFFGMRCASSCYWVLGSIGVEKECKRSKSIRKAFYPKALCTKLIKQAQQQGYKITVQKGRSTRKWEGD